MSVNRYNASTGELTSLATGSRTWIGTREAYDQAKQAGTLPNNCLIAITDDEHSRNSEKISIDNTTVSANCEWRTYGHGWAVKKDNVLYIQFSNLGVNANGGWVNLLDLSSIAELGDITHPLIRGAVCGTAISYDATGRSIGLTYEPPGYIRAYNPMAIDCSGFAIIPLEEEVLI